VIIIERTLYAPCKSTVLVELASAEVGIIQVGVNQVVSPLPFDTGADGDDPVKRQSNVSLVIAGRRRQVHAPDRKDQVRPVLTSGPLKRPRSPEIHRARKHDQHRHSHVRFRTQWDVSSHTASTVSTQLGSGGIEVNVHE